jgi:hypothetical protein
MVTRAATARAAAAAKRGAEVAQTLSSPPSTPNAGKSPSFSYDYLSPIHPFHVTALVMVIRCIHSIVLVGSIAVVKSVAQLISQSLNVTKLFCDFNRCVQVNDLAVVNV